MIAESDIWNYRQASQALASESTDLAWLDVARAEALQRFLADGFPSTDHEDWRYTDLRDTATLSAALLTAKPESAETSPDRAGPALPQHGTEPHLVIVDGLLRPDLSVIPVLEGLSVCRLRDLPERRREEACARISQSPHMETAALFDLNTALLRDAVIVQLSPGTRLEQPLHITCSSSRGSMVQARVLVTLAAASQATVIEQHLSNGVALANTVTDVRCDTDSSLDYARIQLGHDEATHLAMQFFAVADGASVHLTHLDIGARLARTDLQVRLLGAGATVNAHGLFIADGARHLDNHTRIDHLAPRTISRELYRGIMDGDGRGVFNGKVIVHPGAAGTDARLVNQNLLLARTAEIDTKPELEIYADDVKCSHGATTGQLDPVALFYLQSRGIGAGEARRLLVAAFAREIIAQAPRGAITDRLLDFLQARLPDLAQTGGLS